MRRLGTLRPPTGDVRQDAVAALRWCMAGEGLTADKLAILPAVLDLPVVRAAVVGVPAANVPAAALRAVAGAARALGGSVDARLLRTALGIDYDGDARNLTERRAAFDWVGDPRTLFERERKMVEALVTLLGAPPSPRTEPRCATLDVTYRLAGRALRSVEQVYVPSGGPGTAHMGVEYVVDDGHAPSCAVRLTCPVDVLTVRVSFDTSVRPDRAWRIGGDRGPERLSIDRTGCVATPFARPSTSAVYGIGWAWHAPAPHRVAHAIPAVRVGEPLPEPAFASSPA